MKINEVIELAEGGDTTIKRMYSEIATLAAWAGNGKSINFTQPCKTWLDPNLINDPQKSFEVIDYYLGDANNKDASNTKAKKTYQPIDVYYQHALANKERILADMSAQGFTVPSKFGWVGYQSSGQSDITFYGCNGAAGISVKDDGGFGVANLGAGELGLERGSGDAFMSLARDEMISLRRAVMKDLLDFVQKNGAYSVKGKYAIEWLPDQKLFLIRTPGMVMNKQNFERLTGTRQEFMSDLFLETTQQWHRALGRFYVENQARYATLTNAIVVKCSQIIVNAIEKEVIPNAAKLAKLGGFGASPYYYQLFQNSGDFVAYVPSYETADDIQVVGIKPSGKFDTGIDYRISLTRPGAKGQASVSAKLRYDLGAFSRNASFKITDLKGKEHLLWRII